jgi:monofunctional biosynthetic peptidoglycan transglycosylase
MAVQKARSVARVLLVTGAVFVVWLFAVWPPPIWWRDHEPRCTAMMRRRDNCSTATQTVLSEAKGPDGRTATARSDVLERMIIIAEDSRFKTHHGVDFIELREAWATGGRRGASTITQQLAKNLYLSPSRSLLRKLKEAVTAVRLELALPKERIMELYLRVAEWGPGVWGADAASRSYFGVPVSQLSNAQAAALAATLPQPRTSNPLYRPARMLSRRDLILARYYGGKTPVPHIEGDSIPDVPEIEPPILPVIPLDTVVLDSVPDSIPDSIPDSLIHQP